MALNCLIGDGFDLDCMDGLGGIKGLWVLGGTLSGFTTGGTPSAVTGLTGTGTFYAYNIPANQAAQSNFTETITTSVTNGTVFYQDVLNVSFPKLDATKRAQILLLAKNRYLKVVFLDANGTYWCMGLNNGCMVTAGSATTGTALGDANGWTLTFTSQESYPAYSITSGSTLASVTTGITVESLQAT
jgi:hypothetical protein